jgi:hypothetical protein
MFCKSKRAEEIAAHLPRSGHTKLLRIDHEGATVTGIADERAFAALT